MLLKRSGNHRVITGCTLGLLIVVLLVGCGAPSKERVSQDFKQLFANEVGSGIQPIITSVGSGEGDSDNVYQHIKFDVLVEEDVTPKKGWLAGKTLRKGQRLYGGEVVVLYQKKSEPKWVIARHDIKRVPGQPSKQ